MVPLLVPEEQWGPRSWGVNDPLYVRAQIEHGLQEAGYGYWGFSPSDNPAGGYREYGVDAIGMNADGYAVQQRQHLRRPRLRRLPPGAARPAAERLHARRRHAARLVPGAGLRAAGRAGQPRAGCARASLDLRRGRLLRLRRRADRASRAPLPRARPGDGHGGGGQRADRGPAAAPVRAGRRGAAGAAAHGYGAVHGGSVAAGADGPARRGHRGGDGRGRAPLVPRRRATDAHPPLGALKHQQIGKRLTAAGPRTAPTSARRRATAAGRRSRSSRSPACAASWCPAASPATGRSS